MNNEYVCMFWVVNDDLWLEKTSLDEFKKILGTSFYERGTITFRQAHLATWHRWCKKRGYEPGEKHFMYYPRGRTSYFPKTKKFELVIDPCLLNTGHVDNVLSECGISRNNSRIVTQSGDQSLHYICHKCKPDFFDNQGRFKESQFLKSIEK